MDKKFMTIREVAKTGLVTEYFLRQMVKEHRLPGVYSGKSFLVNYSMLVDLLDKESAKNANMV